MSEDNLPIYDNNPDPNKVILSTDEILNKLSNSVEGEKTHERCRTVNSKGLLTLINAGIPGLIYTLRPSQDSRSLRFKYDFGFHSIGNLKLGEEDFLGYDLTNSQGDGFFYKRGSLEEISASLEARFGSIWDLAYTNVENPLLGVEGKLKYIQEKIQRGELVNPTIEDITPDHGDVPSLGFEKGNVFKLLGLKFMPTTDKSDITWNRLRKKFTFGYA